MISGNDAKAEQALQTIERPFFELAVKLGWHITLKEAMHNKGLCLPFERKPMRRLDEPERKQLGELMQKLGL